MISCTTLAQATKTDMTPAFWLAQRNDLRRDISSLRVAGKNKAAQSIERRLPMIEEQLRIIGKKK